MYSVIIKADDHKFLKYKNVTSLLSLTYYLDKNFPKWKYFNVFSSKTMQQIASFTINNKPKFKNVQY